MKEQNILKSLILLVLVFFVGFSGLIGAQYLMKSISKELDHKLENAETRNIIGGNIINHLSSIEASFYQMALSKSPSLAKRLKHEIEHEIEHTSETLDVLENGGKISHIVKLNIFNQTEFRKEFFYYPDRKGSYKLETIDLTPKLMQLLEKLNTLEQLIGQFSNRWLSNERKNEAEKQVNIFTKQLPTHFIRMRENANRLVYQSGQEVETYRAYIQEKREQYLIYQTIFSFTILAIVFLIAYKIIKQVSQTNQKLLDHSKVLQRLAKKADEASKAKSSFLANMSHEIRTPLNAIMGFIDLLHVKETDAVKLDYLKTIKRASNNLLQIISDVLDFSKIESGKIESEEITFNPYEELNSLGDLFTARASEKNVTFVNQTSENMPEGLKGDLLRIKQIIMNLLSNAVKFTTSGKSITYKAQYHDGGLIVDVIDQGPGISERAQEKIFEAFTQADDTTTRKFGGTGLGLAISSQLAELLSGEITLTSQKGEGSHFKLTIPLAESMTKNESRQSDRHYYNGHILVVEDNMVNQKFMKALLKSLGATHEIASDGVEAVEKFNSLTYDIILMDENMPNMSGIDATKKILEIEKENDLAHTPVVAVTANAVQGARDKFLDAGFDEYITKPINKDRLLKVLNRLDRDS